MSDPSSAPEDPDPDLLEPKALSANRALSRRGFLGLCTLFATATGAVYWSRKGGPADLAEQVRKLDAWWQARQSKPDRPPSSAPDPIPNTAEVREYQAFLAAHPLRHLTPREIIRPHFKQRGKVLCGLPPRELWHNLLPTLRVADELRARLEVPLRIVVSAYRSPQYNAKCPGASPYSQHLQNRALDLIFDCGPDKAFAMAEQLRAEGKFTGGLGLYNSFIHIDTRGRNATWGV